MTDEKNPAEQSEQLKVLFRVESGNPTAEELAALTVVLAAATSGGEAEPEPKPIDGWAGTHRRVRSIGTPGVGAWRSQYSPR